MHAWVCTSLQGEEGLEFLEQKEAPCGDQQVRIKTEYVALNFPDVLFVRGEYQVKLDPPFVPGGELAGTVIELGNDVSHLKLGQRVLAAPGIGALSETVLSEAVIPIPDTMPLDEAAGFCTTYGTAMLALHQRGRLQEGETVLVLGAAGGCGSAAVQIAKAMGATVIAGVSSEEKAEAAKKMGADFAVLYRSNDLREAVMELTDNKGVDIVFDPVGDDLFKPATRCIGWNGRYLVIGFAGGEIPSLKINYALLKSIAIVGVNYGMSVMKDPSFNNENFEQLFEWYESGKLKTFVGKHYNCDQLPIAMADLHQGRALGKSVVRFST